MTTLSRGQLVRHVDGREGELVRPNTPFESWLVRRADGLIVFWHNKDFSLMLDAPRPFGAED